MTTLTMTEKDLQTAIAHAAKLGNWLYYHSWSSLHSPAGFPEIEHGRELARKHGWLDSTTEKDRSTQRGE